MAQKMKTDSLYGKMVYDIIHLYLILKTCDVVIKVWDPTIVDQFHSSYPIVNKPCKQFLYRFQWLYTLGCVGGPVIDTHTLSVDICRWGRYGAVYLCQPRHRTVYNSFQQVSWLWNVFVWCGLRRILSKLPLDTYNVVLINHRN